MSEWEHRDKRYMPGLDGIRTMAVIAVIIYHLNVNWAPGGLLGVSMFFVLSGYLITDLLTAEWRKSGKIDLKNFWIRRFRRLLPAMLLMLAAVVTYLTLFEPARLSSLKGDVISSLFYVNNWYSIFHHVSYFQSFGPPSPFGHLWSLAVEEQFYILWPILLMLGLAIAPRRGKMFWLILAASSVSAIAMLFIYNPGEDPSRVYYGTDTRAFSLLIGAALSIIWPSQKLQSRASRNVKLTLNYIGTASLIGIVIMILCTNEFDPWLYPWGFILVSVLTAILVATVAHPAPGIGKCFSLKPLRWLGVRSYGIYIWHYPVIVLTTPAVDSGGAHIVRMILQVSASIILASLSYRYIEQPIRNGLIKQIWRKVKAKDVHLSRVPVKGWITTCIVLILFGISGISMAERAPEAPKTADATNDQATTETADIPASATPAAPPAGKEPLTQPNTPPTADHATSGPYQSEDHQPAAHDPEAHHTDRPEQKDAKPQAPNHQAQNQVKISAIGDSVLLDAAPYLEQYFPGIHVDAKIGRQMSEAADIVRQQKSEGKLGNIVIIELGTNGAFTKSQLAKLMDSLKDSTKVLLVNTRVPRNWESVVNSSLKKAADSYDHAVLVDWHEASRDKTFFEPDGVHLKKEGAKALADLIAGSAGYKK